jgi:uncharacterized FlaG/YvyC family protein
MNELVQNVSAAAPAALSEFRHAPAPVRQSASDQDRQQSRRDEASAETLEELQASIDEMAQRAFAQSKLAIEKNDAAGVFVYRLIDSSNGSVVRQWPTEDFLSLREYLRTKQAGLVDERI